MNDDGHYHSFSEVYGTSTSEKDLPTAALGKQKKTLPFNATQQHVKNVNLLIQREDCDMWRLLFAPSKLSPQSVTQLKSILEEVSYTCGATFNDMEMPNELQSVSVRMHKCYDPIEKLYYSCGFPEIICIYCARTLPETSNTKDYYPQCPECIQPRIKRVRRGRK